jgi:hypothetical protein
MRTHRKTLWLWRSLTLVTVALPAGACLDANVGKVEICEYEGKGYTLNEKFPASDGCNTCKCTIDGDVECTELACADAGTSVNEDAGKSEPSTDAGKLPNCDPAKECGDPNNGSSWDYCKDDDGTLHKLGENFLASDGCNSCDCLMGGTISCTDKACFEPDGSVKPGTCVYANNVYKAGEGFVASNSMCDKCLCRDDGVVECTRYGCPSSDAGTMAPPTKGTCYYLGKTFQIGEGFDRGDNCNKCTCAADGVIECSSNSCMAPPGCPIGPTLIPTGKSITCPDGCNTCTCNQKNVLESTEIACDPLPVIPKCDSSTMTLQFPASLVYQQGDALAVADSRCVNGQANDFSLCFDDLAHTMGQETTIFAVAGSGSRACTGKERVFSLSALRAAYQTLTGQMVGKIVLDGSGNSFVYQIGI